MKVVKIVCLVALLCAIGRPERALGADNKKEEKKAPAAARVVLSAGQSKAIDQIDQQMAGSQSSLARGDEGAGVGVLQTFRLGTKLWDG